MLHNVDRWCGGKCAAESARSTLTIAGVAGAALLLRGDSLDGNGIGDAGLAKLAEALAVNSSLQRLQ